MQLITKKKFGHMNLQVSQTLEIPEAQRYSPI